MTMPNFFEAHESGAYFHGTKADLAIGDLLTPGHLSNYEEGRVMNHIYVTKTLVGAGLAAMMAKGEGRGHVYIVEPEGTLEDDPNVTDKKFPATPLTRTVPGSRCASWARYWTGRGPARIHGNLPGRAGRPQAQGKRGHL